MNTHSLSRWRFTGAKCFPSTLVASRRVDGKHFMPVKRQQLNECVFIIIILLGLRIPKYLKNIYQNQNYEIYLLCRVRNTYNATWMPMPKLKHAMKEIIAEDSIRDGGD